MRKTNFISLVLLAASPVFCTPAFSEEPAIQPAVNQPETSATPDTASPAASEPITPEVASPATEMPSPATSSTASDLNKKNKNVIRAILTTAIEDKEPTDEIVAIDKNKDRIYFFTEFANMTGQAIKHRWEYQGKTMAEVNFNVGSAKWRCYSSKNLLPEWTGIWTVSVIDDKGQVISESIFEVTE